jgi:uncharacterized protein (DUF1800 family)
MVNRDDCAHLLRRATFGPRADELDAAVGSGTDATLARLLTPSTPDTGADRTPLPAATPDPVGALAPDSSREQRQQAQTQQRDQMFGLTLWWLDRMVAADHQLREKLTFFWHGHWATSVQKVKFPQVMRNYQQTLYTHAAGDFGTLVRAMVRDPALVYWLDGHKNTAQAPNENLARELMELFTLGIGNYTEADVKEGARALTGWAVDRTRAVANVNTRRHDGGYKTILGRTGPFGADEFVDILLGQEATARFVTARLWFRFASGDALPAGTHRRLIAAYGPGRDITAVLQAMFSDPAFGATRGQLVKQPVEWAVGAMRQLEIRPGALKPAEQRQLVRSLRDLGQLPFEPPSVGGWPAGAAWLTTSATQLRLRTADQLAGHASPAVLERIAAVPDGQRSDALARILAIDTVTDRTRRVLAEAGTGPPRRLIALALASPEYAVH